MTYHIIAIRRAITKNKQANNNNKCQQACKEIRTLMHYWKEKEREVAQLCLTLCDPMDYNLPGSSVHGVFQTRILEWVAISFSRRSS